MNGGDLEGAPDDDRAAQGKQARLLGLRFQVKIVLLVAEVDAAIAVDGDSGRIDNHEIRNHFSVRHPERSDRATNL